jgi:tRNA pseudouridine55 synthase
MDGLLIVDKPVGPTSHDVVARMRRVLRERRVGHTGTLDPLASGVLPLVVGRATRLARFLSASDKSYEVVVRLGVATDSGDAEGAPLGDAYTGTMPDGTAIARALDAFRGTFLQQPPALSAKKIGGQRSYALARSTGRSPAREHLPARAGALLDSVPASAAGDVLPQPVTVTVSALDILAVADQLVTLRVDCSAGFYVRSLAHDLGAALGTGAHVAALRRTRSGDLTLARAITLADAEQAPERAAAALIPLSGMLPALDRVVLTPGGVRRAAHGQDLAPSDWVTAGVQPAGTAPQPLVRLLSPAGDLVGIAEPAAAPGLLHPSVVLV